MSTHDFLNQLTNNDLDNARETIADILTAKVAEILDGKKQEIAQTLYNADNEDGQEEQEEYEDEDTEQVE